MSRIKKLVKKQFQKYPTLNVNKVIEKIRKKDYVSFDIFDTLIKRNLPDPEDVFSIIELTYKQETGNSIENFKFQRMKAEQMARTEAGKGEITLKDIYTKMLGFDDQVKQKLIDIEIDVELDICCANLELLPVFNWCLENGKKVILISDMYLSKVIVEKILKINGITGYTKLYVSSEHNKTKRTGQLFDLVLLEQNLEASQLIHLGDSFKHDFINAKRMNVVSYRIPKYINRMQRASKKGIPSEELFSYNCLASLVNNKVPSVCTSYYRYGYEAFGMFLWGFSKWLLNDLKEKEINKVYFFSRDGYIMKQAFDLVNDDLNIKTYYIEVSRRSLRVPVLWISPDLNTVLDMLTPSSMISLQSIVDGVGLDINDYVNVLKDFNLGKESKFYRKSILENEGLVNFYNLIKPDIIRQSKREFENLKKYLKQNSFEGKVAIVDIGWSGGMQRYLTQAIEKIGIEADIQGYYTGVASYVKRNTSVIPLKLKGYLFDFSQNPCSIDVRSSFVGLFETLFLEQKGSVKNYYESSGKIMAKRYAYEYLIDGKLAKEAKCVQEIQQGALNFIQDMNKVKSLNLFSYSPETLFKNIKYSGSYPGKNDLKMFSEFRFFDDGEIEYLAKPKSIYYYLTHPRSFVSDFLTIRWKVGFMKRLFKLPLPYEQIYQLLIKLK